MVYLTWDKATHFIKILVFVHVGLLCPVFNKEDVRIISILAGVKLIKTDCYQCIFTARKRKVHVYGNVKQWSETGTIKKVQVGKDQYKA